MENKKTQTDSYSKYTPSENFIQRMRESYEAEKVRKEKWSKEFKQRMSTNYHTYNYNTSIGHLPGSTISGIVTASAISNSAITINNDPVNGSVTIDVPLSVNGRDILKELDEMRDSLLLLKRDVDMEAKYPRLRKLKDEYEAALAKYKTFEALK